MSNETRTIVTNEELTKAIQDSLSTTDIRATVQAELAKQDATAAIDAAAQAAAAKEVADKRAAVDAAAADGAETFSRTEVIGGKEFTFEGASEAALDRAVLNAFKIAYAVQPTESAPVVPVVDPAIAVKEAEAAALAKVELETKFKRGDITTAEYLEQSGAVSDYLTSQGLPLASLKAVVERNESTQEEQSWAAATEEFKNSPAGSDWPGGDKNVKLIGRELAALGLTDAKDKVAALAQAYQSMKSSDIVFPYEPPAAADAADATKTADQIAAEKVVADKAAADTTAAAAAAAAAAALAARTPAKSSSMFGQSSGVHGSSATAAAPDKTEAQKAATTAAADASPAEIIAAWKAANIAAGKDPNAAFTEAFARNRA